jgi:ketosteroid isomerase-like protein
MPSAAPAPGDPHADHVAAPAQGAATAANTREEILAWIKGYDAAFLAKDLDRLATFYHPDVTVYEGAGLDDGWADYRDTHLGPELKAFEDLSFGHSNHAVHMLGDRVAYVTSEFFIKATMKTRTLDLIGRETLIVEKDASGAWKIRHSHTGTRARPAK